MKKTMLVIWVAIAAGCVGGGGGPVGEHSQAIVGGATIEDVDDLGVDADGCHEAAQAGGQPVPVAGRPDLVGVALDGAVVCVTTTEAAVAANPALRGLLDVLLGTPMNGNEGDEPSPEPYEGDDEDDEEDSEPSPEPYDGGEEDGDGSSADDAPDSQ